MREYHKTAEIVNVNSTSAREAKAINQHVADD